MGNFHGGLCGGINRYSLLKRYDGDCPKRGILPGEVHLSRDHDALFGSYDNGRGALGPIQHVRAAHLYHRIAGI